MMQGGFNGGYCVTLAKDYEESLERIGRQLIEIAKGPTPEPQNIEELSRYNMAFQW